MRRLNFLRGRAARERDRDAEMRAHLDLFIEQLVERGLSPEEAARQARLQFGNPRAKLEEIHDMNRVPFVETFWRDAPFACSRGPRHSR